PHPVLLSATKPRSAPAKRPRTQRGAIGLRCRADRNMVFSPPWERARTRRQASCPPALGRRDLRVAATDRSIRQLVTGRATGPRLYLSNGNHRASEKILDRPNILGKLLLPPANPPTTQRDY